MLCPACATANESGAKFCVNCGTRLAVAAVCSRCAAPLREGVRFCGECGTPVSAPEPIAEAAAPEPATPSAERRLVSVLFADLVGFTPFSEERDAEEVRDTLSRYFDLAKDLVGRYGGTIEKFIGDAVMAVWGTPTAHEDDAERAVRAAIDLVEAVPTIADGFRARAGVMTGEAVVTLGATDQGMVAGDLVNSTSRLQAAAPPGSVLVGEGTYRAASKAVAFEPAGELQLKGKTETMPAWRAMRVVAERGGRNRSETLEAPFVGREPELRLLKDLLHATSRERRARLVSVTGIAGIGKSRLGWEFEKYLDGLVATVRWHAGRSPAYGEGVTFWALGEMVRSRAGLLEGEDPDTTRRKIADTVDQWVVDEDERRWIEGALLVLLGIGDPAGAGREGLFAAWRTFFERIAAQDVVTMVFEDLHWADPGLLDFIDHVLEWSRDFPIYIVTLARPELLERRPDWGAGKRNFTAIGLDPLADDEMRLLLDGLVPGLPGATRDAIVSRAEGVPLYAIEMVRVLVSEGRLIEEEGRYRPVGNLGNIALPETLHALIAARLDALDPADRALLQDAAVLGQSFTPAGLSSIVGASHDELEPRLRALVRKEVLAHKVDPRSPERGQYSFVQGLIREVAYNTLARPDRKTRHLAVARWVETLGEEEHAGALAAHYLAAFQNSAPGPEAEALAVQARIALKGAGDRAAGLGSHEQAMAFYDQALGVSANSVERVELLLRGADAATNASRHDEAERRARQALELERAGSDRLAILTATVMLARILINAYRVEQALELLEQADRDSVELRHEPVVIELGGQLARGYLFAEKLRQSVAVADRVLEAAEHANLLPVISDTLITKGIVLANIGRAYEGLGLLRAGQEIADAHGLTNLRFRAYVNRSAAEVSFDPRSAYETAREGLALSKRLGWPAYSSLVVNYAAAAMKIGEWDAAADEVARTLDAGLDRADWLQVAGHAAIYAMLRGREPDTAALAAAAADEGGELARLVMQEVGAWRLLAEDRLAEAYREWIDYAGASSLNAPDALVLAARAALWQRDASAARNALRILDEAGLHGRALDTLRRAVQAGIHALEGRRAEALIEYRDVLRTMAELRLSVEEALTGIDMLAVLGPDVPDALAAGERARQILQGLDGQMFLRRLQALGAPATAGAPRASAAAEGSAPSPGEPVAG